MRLGNPTQYIEPFCGSAAVLLAAPRPASLEVIGDGSGFIANFWRATKHQSAVVAEWADYPVSHIDLGARHVWLMAQRTRIGDAMQDPDWPGDAKVAGWWLWGQCCWIGSGWCDWFGKIPHASDAGMGVQAIGKIPHISDAGLGVQAIGKIPHAGNAGMGVQAIGQIPHAGNAGMGDGELLTSCGRTAMAWLRKIANRLERVFVAVPCIPQATRHVHRKAEAGEARGAGTVNVLDLFCGASGGWSSGLESAGYRTVAACELDDWRRNVFAARHPGCRMYADVRELTADRLRADLGYLPDAVVGSPPCQELSAANSKGKGITDDHLFWDWARLVFEIRPLWCAAENSPRARTAGIDGILDALDQANYAFWPLVVGADNAGSNHRRKRLWLFAADADRIELWEQSWRRCWANRRPTAVPGDHGRNDGAELPAALRDIGRAWPDWNDGIAGLSAACAAAGFGALDDGTDPILAPGLRNRCIAALGDAVVPQIPEAIGNAIMKTSNGSKTLTMT
jgi:site-specific DNA-cytosine methylase